MSGIPLFSLRWDKYLDKIIKKVKIKTKFLYLGQLGAKMIKKMKGYS